jgi:hypothetical protein
MHLTGGERHASFTRSLPIGSDRDLAGENFGSRTYQAGLSMNLNPNAEKGKAGDTAAEEGLP